MPIRSSHRLSERARLLAPLAASAAISAPRPHLKGQAAIDQMADDLRVIKTRAGGVSRDDLALLGWTQSQIDRHGTAARERAERLSHDSAAA